MGVDFKPDVVVIGSGAGGGAVAWRLTRAGAKVLLLEAGPRFDPPADYPMTNADWERRSFPNKTGSRGAVSYGDLGVLAAEHRDLHSWTRVKPTIHQIGQPRQPTDQGYSHVMGVGGSTLHFVGEAHRLHPDAFRLHTKTGQGADWPLSYDALEPYYTEAETQIGVAGQARAEPDRWRSAEYPMAAHPLSPGAIALQAAGKHLGQHWVANPRAVNSASYDDRPACNYCGQCARGCPLGDKGSVDVTLLRKAQDSGHLKLIAGAHVTRIHMGKNAEISHVTYVKDGREITQLTPALVLSAGAVQTPRLLLLSKSAEQPDGVANGSQQVGRNFMETLWWHSVGLVEGLSQSHKGLPADLTEWSKTGPGQVTGLAGGYKLTHNTLDIGLNGPMGYAARVIPGFGADFKQQMRKSFGSALAVGAVGQVIADDRSFVALDETRLDQFGNPLAQINSVLTGNSLDLLHQMAATTRMVLKAANAELVEEAGSWDKFQSTHVFGTARMGDEAATSVVQATGQSHDHPNLWIADASVFPTSGGGEAPSLTIMALAMRTADAILAT